MTEQLRTAASGLQQQRSYLASLGEGADQLGLVVAEAFVESMRDVGYRHTGTALDEILDNSIQAGATEIAVLFGYNGGSKKPASIAVVDNGHGMDPAMIRMAVTWGGTARYNEREGFGRFGFGLPSACVSQGRSFTVYSKPADGVLHSLTVDLDDIRKGRWSEDGHMQLPAATPADLPRWVTKALAGSRSPEFTGGTVVVIDKLDRLSWTSQAGLSRNLLEHIGVTYRNYLTTTRVRVDGKAVEPTDPLFTTPGMRFFDLTPVHAEPLEPMEIQVESRHGSSLGIIRVRFSSMPPGFIAPVRDGEEQNARFKIMKEHRGLIVCRAGRQIDVLDAKCPWRTFQNYDVYWGVEIDFSPVLDEEFNITSHKQQVVLTDRAWQILESAGVRNAVRELARRTRREFAEARTKQDQGEQAKRPSEAVMEEVQKFKTRKPTPTAEQEQEAQRKLETEVRRRAAISGVPEDIVRPEVEREFAAHPFKVRVESSAGGPFFRVDQVGGSRILFLNSDHRFFQEVYSGPSADARLRFQLEALLFVLGDAELDARGDRRTFYETERASVWSPLLNIALERLDKRDSVDDEFAAQAEEGREGIGE